MSDVVTPFTPTRTHALDAHKQFLPFAVAYARTRNYCRDGKGQDVSQLSPYINHRLLLEQEVVGDVLGRFTVSQAEKYIQEICWRTYWKGWLQMRPQLWQDYCAEVVQLKLDFEESSHYQKAVGAHTGIDCFDDWVKALITTGYLHNHARMWFASIWIFTLKLPWQLGAAFFLKHLLDGDAASNTLSWRWVAGLHTQGKYYLARAANIEKYTEGQYNPKGQLNESDSAFNSVDAGIAKTYDRQSLSNIEPLALTGRCGLLITSEDCAPEVSCLSSEQFVSVAGAYCNDLTDKTGWVQSVANFKAAAINDALIRASTAWQCDHTLLRSDDWQASLAQWLELNDLDTVVVIEPPVGPWSDRLATLSLPPSANLCVYRRPWDNTLWPYATAGFFKLKKQLAKKLPELVGVNHA